MKARMTLWPILATSAWSGGGRIHQCGAFLLAHVQVGCELSKPTAGRHDETVLRATLNSDTIFLFVSLYYVLVRHHSGTASCRSPPREG